ncbi:MAG: Sec-independent protein translocase subunit TatA/TatB [Pyrinomonadaceae bacterium]
MTHTILAIAGLGTTEHILIGAVIVLLFGASRLPQLAKALGQI